MKNSMYHPDLVSYTYHHTECGSVIRYFSLLPDKSLSAPGKGFYHFLFVLEGRGELSFSGKNKLYLQKGDFSFISQDDFWEITTLYHCSVLLFSFDNIPDPSDKLFFRSLFPYIVNENYKLSVHRVKAPLESYIQLLLCYLQDGVSEESLREIKLQELFLLLRRYYSFPELTKLFYPLICRSHDFRQVILDNYQRVKNTRELMKICNMRRTSFERKFRKEFGLSAHQWLLKQKAEKVRKTLADPDYTLEEVRKLYEFNSATHFVRFCRTQFGCTPTTLRKRLISDK